MDLFNHYVVKHLSACITQTQKSIIVMPNLLAFEGHRIIRNAATPKVEAPTK